MNGNYCHSLLFIHVNSKQKFFFLAVRHESTIWWILYRFSLKICHVHFILSNLKDVTLLKKLNVIISTVFFIYSSQLLAKVFFLLCLNNTMHFVPFFFEDFSFTSHFIQFERCHPFEKIKRNNLHSIFFLFIYPSCLLAKVFYFPCIYSSRLLAKVFFFYVFIHLDSLDSSYLLAKVFSFSIYLFMFAAGKVFSWSN